MTESLRSYTARVPCVDEAAARALDAYARRFSIAVRWAFAQQDKAILAGRAPTKAQRKQAVLERFGLTSRQSNAVLVEADGKRAAQLELDDTLDQSLTEQIVKKSRLLAAAQKTLAEHRKGQKLRLSAKALRDLKRRIFPLTTALACLTAKRARLRARTNLGLTRMTFGTKKLLRRRAGLTSEQDVAAWRKQWDDARNSQFLVLGSKDEAGGCQGCGGRHRSSWPRVLRSSACARHAGRVAGGLSGRVDDSSGNPPKRRGTAVAEAAQGNSRGDCIAPSQPAWGRAGVTGVAATRRSYRLDEGLG